MNALPVSEQRLCAVRGRFRDPTSFRIVSRVFALILIMATPIGPAALILSRGSPFWPLTAFEWVLILAVAGTFAAAVTVWRSGDREYEFTGEEILERRRGVLKWRVPISSLTRVRLEKVQGGGVWAHLYSGPHRYSVFLVPALHKQLLGPET